MGAPKGNQFWKLRSKHGRNKLFESPELLWDAACEYFQWCVETPFMKTEQSKSRSSNKKTEVNEGGIETVDTGLIEIPVMRPFTMEGICHYLDCNRGYFNDFEASLKGKKGDINKDFSIVITRIRETIYRQKFEGAASGFLNPNIIARDLGLADKKAHTVKVGKDAEESWED